MRSSAGFTGGFARAIMYPVEIGGRRALRHPMLKNVQGELDVSYVSFGWVGENRDIKVELDDGTWMTVHRVDGQPDERMIKMFGSHKLPTPWKEDTDKDTVISELAARNPHATVG